SETRPDDAAIRLFAGGSRIPNFTGFVQASMAHLVWPENPDFLNNSDEFMSQLPALEVLKTLGVKELQAHWRAIGGSGIPPTTIWLLVREIAWRSQFKDEGGLDAEARRRLLAAVRSVQAKSSVSRESTKGESRVSPRVK